MWFQGIGTAQFLSRHMGFLLQDFLLERFQVTRFTPVFQLHVPNTYNLRCSVATVATACCLLLNLPHRKFTAKQLISDKAIVASIHVNPPLMDMKSVCTDTCTTRGGCTPLSNC